MSGIGLFLAALLLTHCLSLPSPCVHLSLPVFPIRSLSPSTHCPWSHLLSQPLSPPPNPSILSLSLSLSLRLVLMIVSPPEPLSFPQSPSVHRSLRVGSTGYTLLPTPSHLHTFRPTLPPSQRHSDTTKQSGRGLPSGAHKQPRERERERERVRVRVRERECKRERESDIECECV